MRTIAVFDFDGTLTTKDTLIDFIKYVHGANKMVLGFLIYSPLILLMRFGFLSNEFVKQRVFCYFFRGMSYETFQDRGKKYSKRIEAIRNTDTYCLLNLHKQDNSEIYVITASIEDWVRPWCNQNGIEKVIGTQVEVDSDGKLTGRFNSRNCYGKEKVRRLLELEPNRDEYVLYAYGDSKGDKEMIEFADYGKYV